MDRNEFKVAMNQARWDHLTIPYAYNVIQELWQQIDEHGGYGWEVIQVIPGEKDNKEHNPDSKKHVSIVIMKRPGWISQYHMELDRAGELEPERECLERIHLILDDIEDLGGHAMTILEYGDHTNFIKLGCVPGNAKAIFEALKDEENGELRAIFAAVMEAQAKGFETFQDYIDSLPDTDKLGMGDICHN
jgi:hypothetical protein